VSWLLDTNVISESKKKVPDPQVMSWLDNLSEEEIFLSAIPVGEVRRGIILLPDSPKRRFLMTWINEEVPERFANRILPIDNRVAISWANLVAGQQMKGRNLPVLDSLIVATAGAHQLTVATRNIDEMRGLGGDLFNPWTNTFH